MFPIVAYRVADGSLIGESKEAKLKWSLRARGQAIPAMTLPALKTRVRFGGLCGGSRPRGSSSVSLADSSCREHRLQTSR